MAITPNPYQIFYGPTDVQSYDPDSDLSSYYQKFVKITGDRQVGHFTAVTDIPAGVLQNKPNNTTGPSLEAKVQSRGTALVVTGTGGLEASDLVGADETGAGITIDPDVGGAFAHGLCVVGATVGLAASVLLFGAPVWIPAAAQ